MTSMMVFDLLPGLPPVSILTVIAFSIVAASMTLYLLSRVPELLLITGISFLYGLVPVLAMVKHL